MFNNSIFVLVDFLLIHSKFILMLLNCVVVSFTVFRKNSMIFFCILKLLLDHLKLIKFKVFI